MNAFKISILFLCFCLFAQAEEKIISYIYTGHYLYNMGYRDKQNVKYTHTPISNPPIVEQMLKDGWKIKIVQLAGNYYYGMVIIYVMEKENSKSEDSSSRTINQLLGAKP